MRHATSLRRLLAALSLVLLLGACSAFRGPLTPPEKGGPPWLRLASEHFVVETDVDQATARAILGRLEESHAALAHALRRPARQHEIPIEVVVFERHRDFDDIAGQKLNAAAFFRPEAPGDLEPKPLIVMRDSDLVDEVRMTAQHELAHRFLHERFASLPMWLNEGLAVYYASARVEGGKMILGAPSSIDFSERPFFWVAWKETFEQEEVPLYLAPTLRTLIEADRAEFYAQREDGERSQKDLERVSAFYAASWRLVHLLMNGPNAGHRARFAGFLDDLGRGAKARDAFLERFGDDWPALDQAYRAYLSVDRVQVATSEVRPPPGARERPAEVLPPRDVHLLWARIMPWTKDNMARVRDQLDQAGAIDARAPALLLQRTAMFLHLKDLNAARASAEAAVAQAPDDPRALYALVQWHQRRAQAAGQPETTPPELVERLARTAATATQLAEVAWLYGRRGRIDEGLALSTRALAVDPLCWGCVNLHAALLFSKGRIDEAAAANERAIAIAPERVRLDGALALRREIGRARVAPRPPAK